MIIKSISLENYRRFRSLSLEFQENLQGFLGANGAGKSTIIEAIAWALYGSRAARGSKNEIRSHSASPKDKCTVCLIFEAGGVNYKIVRQLRGKTAIAEASIFMHGSDEPLAVQEAGVNSFVEQTIGLDYRSFFASVFARQKDLAALGEMRPEERKIAINRLINIEAIDKARKLAMERRTAAENELRGMQSMLKDTDELKKRRAECRKALEHESAAVALARKSVQTAQKELDSHKTHFAELSNRRDQFHSIQAEIGQKKSEKSGVEQQLASFGDDLKRIEKSEQQIAGLEKDRIRYLELRVKKEELEKQRLLANDLKKYREDLSYHLAQAESEQKIILRLRNEITHAPNPERAFDDLDTRKETLEQQEKKLLDEERTIIARLGVIESKGKEVGEKKKQIQEMGQDSPCPVCERPLGDHRDTVLAKLESELQQLRGVYRQNDKQKRDLAEQIAINKEAQNDLQHEREKLTEQVTLVRRKRQDIKEYEQRKNRYTEKADAIRKEIAALGEIRFDEKEYLQLLAEHEKLSTIYEHLLKLERDVERKDQIISQQKIMKQQQQALTTTLQELQQKLAALDYEEAAFQAAKLAYEKESEHFQTLRQTLADAEKAEIAAQTRLQNTEDELQRAEEQLKKVAHLQEEKQYFDALAYHFGRFRMQLAGRLRPLIAARSSELLRLTTSGRYSLLELDEDYNIHIIDQGQSFPLQRFSGGEQDLANLCLRVAISQVVAERSGKTPVQLIVLDEVFGSQDARRQQLIMQALQLLQSQFRQIFIISHVESIKEILPVIFQVEMVSAHESKAVMI